MYYGQFSPPVDWLIEKFFPENFIGSCVEVGAADGRNHSNTLHFEERGWQCLCIEPNTFYHPALIKIRNLVLSYAVSNRNQDNVPLHRVKINNSYEACTALVLDDKLLQQHQSNIQSTDQILVSARTLDFCLEEARWFKTDFVAIDTEGTELSALEGFTLERWKPRLLVIENNHNTPNITEYLKPRGYQHAIRHEVNDFYLRTS